MNEIKEELYQSMMIGDLTISSDTSKQILDYMEEKDKEIERLNKDLQTAIDICNTRQKEIVRLNNEIERLNNIIILHKIKLKELKEKS